MKTCFKCKTEKDESDFWKTCAYCKPCDLDYRKIQRVRNKQKRREQRMKIWREKNSRSCKKCGSSFVGRGLKREYCSTICKIQGNISKKRNGCWEWKGQLHPNGYGYTTIYERKKKVHVHRASYIIFKGEIPKGLYVCHACDNPRCCNPEHLWTGTAKENMQDAKAKGRLKRSK